jgi:hypothetical protein
MALSEALSLVGSASRKRLDALQRNCLIKARKNRKRFSIFNAN